MIHFIDTRIFFYIFFGSIIYDIWPIKNNFLSTNFIWIPKSSLSYLKQKALSKGNSPVMEQ